MKATDLIKDIDKFQSIQYEVKCRKCNNVCEWTLHSNIGKEYTETRLFKMISSPQIYKCKHCDGKFTVHDVISIDYDLSHLL